MVRVSVYIDGANFLGGIKSINSKYMDFYFDFERYVKRITKNHKLINVYYYTALLKQELHPELYEKQIRLINRLRKANYLIRIAKRKPQLDDKGNVKSTKIKEDDVWLAVDMTADAHDNKYDTAILISGDGDFVPLVKHVREKGKRVENIYFEGCISFSLMRVCNNCSKIDKKIVNKFFYRE